MEYLVVRISCEALVEEERVKSSKGILTGDIPGDSYFLKGESKKRSVVVADGIVLENIKIISFYLIIHV